MSREKLSAVVLAAGKGTRMRNSLPKVLHLLAGRTLIGHVVALVEELGCVDATVVLAPGMEAVAAEVERLRPGTVIAIQDPPLGTGHAVAAALPSLLREGTLVVLYGDTPLLRAATVRQLVGLREAEGAAVAVLGMRPPVADGYGRLRVEAGSDLLEIVEHKHADEELRLAAACNSGVMAIDAARIDELIRAVPLQAGSGEYYLTDIVAAARARGWRCVAQEAAWQEGHGVNAQAQLAEATALWQVRRRTELLESGVIMPAPETVHLAIDNEIAPGVLIEPYVVLGPDVRIAAGATIRSFSHIEGARIEAGVTIGPFARLRPGTSLAEGARVGNFVEVKNARLEAGAKANHLTYLGDCTVGAKANIGAGTITCNYDGFNKSRTEIGAGAFIGSNAALVAPVRVGDEAIIGAGSVVTKDVPDGAVAVARGEQRIILDAAAGMRRRHKSRAGKRHD